VKKGGIYGWISVMFHKMYHAYLRAVNKLLEEMERMLNFQYMSCSRSITFTYTKNAEDFISEEFSNNLAIINQSINQSINAFISNIKAHMKQ